MSAPIESTQPCATKYKGEVKIFLQMLDSKVEWLDDYHDRMAFYYFDCGIPASICALNIVKAAAL